MELLIHVSTPQAAQWLKPLGQACARAGIHWGCFITNDGVKVMDDSLVLAALASAKPVIVCGHAWNLHMPGQDCPAQMGSQSNNSDMMSKAQKVISL